MAAKRSRIVRSSSFGNSDMFNQLIPSPNDSSEIRVSSSSSSSSARRSLSTAAKVLKISPLTVESSGSSRPGILTLPTPEIDNSCEGMTENFCEQCYLCGKRIGQKDVFMYGYLQAFCSSKCRDDQIAIDTMVEKAAKRAKESGNGSLQLP